MKIAVNLPVPTLATQRPYYADSYRTTFDATVTETSTVDGHPGVVLDATFFYPTSGGQPFDTGSVAGRRVVDVRVREADGAVVHLLDQPLPTGPVSCQVDWPRRWDHIQQHTGQHILSQAFIRLANAATIGFHLGADYVSIDLDIPTLTDGGLADAFAMANDVVQRNLSVKAWFPTGAELAQISLRKAPEVDGPLRIVAIGDFDVSACGGTHVRQTAEVGLIHLLRTERLKRGVRVAFHCGDRARVDYAQKHRLIAETAAALACGPAELPTAVARLRGQVVDLERRLAVYRESDLDREAEALAGRATATGPYRVIREVFEGRPAEELKGLAMRLTASTDAIALLATTGERSHFILARPERSAVDLKPALDAALAVIGGGRGGGSRVVQGGGQSVSTTVLAAALEAAQAALPATST